MIKSLIHFVLLTLLLISLTACPEKLAESTSFYFMNNSSKEISCYLGLVPRINGGTLYPDTMISEVKTGYENDTKSGTGFVYRYYRPFNLDTISLYIYDCDTVKAYTWDEIKAGYKILQRYDLDVEYLKTHYYIYYPPTEEMKHIKMYPPYKDSIE